MRRSCLLWFVLGATAFLLFGDAPAAQSQVAIYAEFSASDFNLPNIDWQYGTTFGLYYNAWTIPFFAVGLDGRGSVVGSGSPKIDSGLAGPRITFKPHVLPVMPYVEALVGFGHAEYGQGAAQTSKSQLEYQFLGGADFTIFPRIDWRAVEFSYGGLSGQGFNPRTLSTGLVFRLP